MDFYMSYVYLGQGNDDIPVDVTHVNVHPSFRDIRGKAFITRYMVTFVMMPREGLKEIGEEAFGE